MTRRRARYPRDHWLARIPVFALNGALLVLFTLIALLIAEDFA